MSKREEILNNAKSLIGYTNYKLGAKYYTHNNNKEKPKYLDCSGFVVWCYKMSGFNVADGTYMQWQTSESVLEKELKIGDIGIMKENGTGTYNHVGIYAGDGYWIHCNYSRNGVTLEKTNIFKYPRRFINVVFEEDHIINREKEKIIKKEDKMPRIIEIESDGKIPTVTSINVDNHEYVKLQDLAKLGLLKVSYDVKNKRPIIEKA